MKVRQYNIKIFEIVIDDKERFFQFVKKNEVLLKDVLLYLRGNIDEEIEQFLAEKNLLFTTKLPHPNSSSHSAGFVKNAGMMIIDQVVRSGQEIVEKRDVLALKRINSGASIQTDGNFVALERVEGTIVCNGDFMMLRPTKKAQVLFKGVDLSNEFEEGFLYEIKFNENQIELIKRNKGV